MNPVWHWTTQRDALNAYCYFIHGTIISDYVDALEVSCNRSYWVRDEVVDLLSSQIASELNHLRSDAYSGLLLDRWHWEELQEFQEFNFRESDTVETVHVAITSFISLLFMAKCANGDV
jgi:hypothetical protein